MANVYRAKLDLKKVYTDFKPIFVQYDHARLEIELLDDGKTYDLSTAEYVDFTHVLSDDTVFIARGEIVAEGTKKLICYEYQGSEMNLLGTIKTSFAIFDANNKKVSAHTFTVEIIEDLRDEIFNPAQPTQSILQTLISDVDVLKNVGVGQKGEPGEPGEPGKDGKDGYTPVKGIDYFDGEPGERGPQGEPGKDGKDGYTPVKGIDYFDGEPGRDGEPGKDGYTPIKGIDYFDGEPGRDGEPGKDGYTPIKGIDYFDGEPGKDGEPGRDGEPGKDGKDGRDGEPGRDGYTPIKGIDYFDGEPGPRGEPGSDANITAHVSDNAPHKYGNRFEWRYNPLTDSLDLVVLT